jgi:hypothetical protein
MDIVIRCNEREKYERFLRARRRLFISQFNVITTDILACVAQGSEVNKETNMTVCNTRNRSFDSAPNSCGDAVSRLRHVCILVTA